MIFFSGFPLKSMTKSSCEKSNGLWLGKYEVCQWNQTVLGGKSSSLEWSKAHHQKKNILASRCCLERQKNGKLNDTKLSFSPLGCFWQWSTLSAQREQARWQTNIEMCSQTWIYVAWKSTSSFQLNLMSFTPQNREQLDPVDPQKNYKSWRDDKRAEIPSPLYGSYLFFLYQGIFKTWANRFWYSLKYVNNIYLLLVLTQLGMKYSQRCTSIN